jgi:hypothetical protein
VSRFPSNTRLEAEPSVFAKASPRSSVRRQPPRRGGKGPIQNDSGLSQGLAGHFGGGSQTEAVWLQTKPDIYGIAFGGFAMAMTSYLDDFDVDAGTKEVLDLALEMTRTALGLADNFANGIIAKRIIELARAGERHPDLLCEGALKTLRGHLFGD